RRSCDRTSERTIAGKRSVVSERIIVGKRSVGSERIIVGKRGVVSERIIVGKRGVVSERIIVRKRGVVSERNIVRARSREVSGRIVVSERDSAADTGHHRLPVVTATSIASLLFVRESFRCCCLYSRFAYTSNTCALHDANIA
ncbi:hypothetical protein, partial [Stenotrophomonas sp. PS02289]|uniref:hypothetical protein n=1 Tax=Stenotrophomonas sp. PS02289 TaxID=2991422 RepID=UPI00249CA18C